MNKVCLRCVAAQVQLCQLRFCCVIILIVLSAVLGAIAEGAMALSCCAYHIGMSAICNDAGSKQ